MHGSYGRFQVEAAHAQVRQEHAAKEQAIAASLKKVIHYDVENAPLGYPFATREDFDLAYKHGIHVDDAMRDVAAGKRERVIN